MIIFTSFLTYQSFPWSAVCHQSHHLKSMRHAHGGSRQVSEVCKKVYWRCDMACILRVSGAAIAEMAILGWF